MIATRYGSTGRSVTDRDGYPSRERACLTFADLETCLALAVIDHNQQQNDKTLKVPLAQWQAQAADLPRFHDDPHRVLLNFLPVQWRVLTPQGSSLFAMTYYAPWLGRLVSERDRIGKLEVRYDPRDISHVYVRDPHSDDFLPVARRDGVATPLTLCEHIQHRGDARAAHARSDVEKVAIRRQIAGIAKSARQKKAVLRQAVRAAHAAAGQKPYQAMTPQAPAPNIRSGRSAAFPSRNGKADMAEHLLDHVRPYLHSAIEDRVAFIRSPRWIGYDAALQAQACLRDLLVRPPSLRTGGVLLVGPYANGKTMIAERFAIEHLRTTATQKVWVVQTSRRRRSRSSVTAASACVGNDRCARLPAAVDAAPGRRRGRICYSDHGDLP